MAELALLAAGLLAGLPWWAAAALGLGMAAPAPALVGVLGLAAGSWVLARPPQRRGEEQQFLHAVAGELRSGSGLRGALAAAANRHPTLGLGGLLRLLAAGRPLTEVSTQLAEGLPRHGRLAVAALRVASTTGGRTAAVFDGLALLAAEDDELARERRAATAQARASAAVVAGIPLGWVLVTVVSGRLPVGSPVALGLSAVGLSLVLAGVAMVVWLLRRVQP